MKIMHGLQIQIRLDDSKAVYIPGESIGGNVILQNTESWDAHYVDVLLGWRTTGRGNEDGETIQTIQLYTRDEHVSPRVEKHFNFRIPRFPWTYHGHLIKLDWLIGVYVKAKGAREISEETNFIVHPAWHENSAP